MLFFFLLFLHPPTFTLFPYTTLFRSLPTRTVPRLRAAISPDGDSCQNPSVPSSLIGQTGTSPSGAATDSLGVPSGIGSPLDRKSTRLNSSHANISYAVFCLKKKTKRN